jgi:hypothetical protein
MGRPMGPSSRRLNPLWVGVSMRLKQEGVGGVSSLPAPSFDFPDFDCGKAFRLRTGVNESDFLPLFFVRHVAQMD